MPALVLLSAAAGRADAQNAAGGTCGDGTCQPSEICTCSIDCGPPSPEAGSCTDGLDNDCDGNTDCSDVDCITHPACAGVCPDTICDLAELCSCPADCGVPPTTEAGSCTDRLDNDCDSVIDCADPDCFTDTTCAGTCGDGTCVTSELCTCPADCGAPDAFETAPAIFGGTCYNGIDDDCDGTADCSDPDCVPAEPNCGPPGCGDNVCASSTETPCNCPFDCGQAPSSEIVCNDGLDNDCDGEVDCTDSECANKPGVCGNPICPDGTCDPSDICTCFLDCGPPPPSEVFGGNHCGDGLDNDCDGHTDCADTDCLSVCCGNSTCAPPENRCNCSADCGTPPATEAGSCADGQDNDCDTLIDCSDPDCAGDPACCGDCSCDGGENQCTCPADCGMPPSSETGACTDSLDNDCDTYMDCADPDCTGDSACFCGNGTCDAGESPCTCSSDCGTPVNESGTLCLDFQDNDCDGKTDCDDSACCFVQGCQVLFGCRDGTCGAGENSCNCACDCGAPPSTETACSDGVDNDCDGTLDCADSDCQNLDADDDTYVAAPCGNDCDDASPGTNPGATESCTDTVDNDCDGLTDCGDPDCQGNTACAACCTQVGSCYVTDTGSGAVVCANIQFGFLLGSGSVCAATVACCKAGGCVDQDENCCLASGGVSFGTGSSCAAQPSTEVLVCGDGLDNDCDGATDCADSDCHGSPACCGDTICDPLEDSCTCPSDCGPPAGSEAGLCNDGLDNDCDGGIDCADSECSAPCGGTCGDGTCIPSEQCNCPSDCGTIPGSEATGLCADGIDNDCDGLADCADSDCFGAPSCCGDGTCDVAESTCSCIADCGNPAVSETCNNGTDDDCDGFADCLDTDCGTDPSCFCGDGTCGVGEGSCNCPADCGAPAGSEAGLCADNIDNDCDGAADCLDFSDCCTDSACVVGFGCGDGICQLGETQCTCPCDCFPPPASEAACTDGNDNDCDGLTDCNDPDCQTLDADNDTYFSIVCGGTDCDDTDMNVHPGATESCTDSIDNDCNGSTDCDDPACAGSGSCTACCYSFFGISGCLNVPVGDPGGTCGGLGGAQLGAGTICLGQQACCNGGTCASADAACCFATPLGQGTFCANLPVNETTCNDGLDDDCDGDVDCDDCDCFGDPACCGNNVCDTPGENSCNCPSDCGSPTSAESSCTDGNDNDCDGCTDTADDDCGGTETSCSDGMDDDCDGLVDCNDSDCAGHPACCGDGTCDTPTENSCNCSSDCGPPATGETACADGLDDDCDGCIDDADVECGGVESACTNSQDDDCDGCTDTADDDCGGTETNCDDSVDNDCDGDIDCDDSDCAADAACVQVPPALLPDASGIDKNRVVSFVPPTAAVAGATQTAIRIIPTTLYDETACAPRGGALPDLSAFENEARWLGAPARFPEDAVPAMPDFIAAEVQCTPHFRDWSPAALAADFTGADVSAVHVFGAVVVPCSSYELQAVHTSCPDLADENCYSDALLLTTAVWGDIWESYGLVNFIDINEAVLKYKGIAYQVGPPESGAPPKIRAMLRGNIPPLDELVSFIDISLCVDGYKAIPYKEPGPTTCP